MTRAVVTPVGTAEVVLAVPSATRAPLLMLGHGAGGDLDAPDLVLVRDACLRHGIAVAMVRQPYRVAGRRAPVPAGRLDAAWVAVANALRSPSQDPVGAEHRGLSRRPLVVAGRSSGARVACRTASAVGAVAVVALAFPLHPPGRPERSRAGELGIDVPVLVVQGERDAFGGPAQLPPGPTVLAVAGADHGLRGAGMREAAERVAAWIAERGAESRARAGRESRPRTRC